MGAILSICANIISWDYIYIFIIDRINVLYNAIVNTIRQFDKRMFYLIFCCLSRKDVV